jgi:small redox-active disulfide protein 2
LLAASGNDDSQKHFPKEDSVDIKVLGPGCANCRTTVALIEQVAKAKGVAVELQKVEDLQQIMSYGVMSTPGVVIDGKVVHAGGVPGREKIENWLAGAPA